MLKRSNRCVWCRCFEQQLILALETKYATELTAVFCAGVYFVFDSERDGIKATYQHDDQSIHSSDCSSSDCSLSDHRPAWLDRGRIPALDGLRAIAVFLVCLAHVEETKGFPRVPFLPTLSRFGGLGVDVFFVLSGFLITNLLYREREKFGRVSLQSFYLRRGFRIIPAYICFLLFVAALAVAGIATPNARDWVAAGTFTMNFIHRPAWELGHIWSLSIEEHFYLVWPLVFAALSRRAAVAVLVGVLIVGPLIRCAVLIWWPMWSPMTDLWTFTRLDAIAAGCLLALLPRSPGGLRWINVAAKSWHLVVVVLIAGLAAGSASGKVSVAVTPTVTAIAIAILLWAAARRPPGWFENPVVVSIGAGSYSLYLWQQPFLNPHSDWSCAAFPQNLLFAGLIASLSYWLVERPMLRFKNRFQSQTVPVSVSPVSSQ